MHYNIWISCKMGKSVDIIDMIIQFSYNFYSDRIYLKASIRFSKYIYLEETVISRSRVFLNLVSSCYFIYFLCTFYYLLSLAHLQRNRLRRLVQEWQRMRNE